MQTNKPPLPVTIPVLTVVVVVGLVAQFLAAWAAFELVFSPAHAFFAAALIESMVAVEALATARTRSEVALVGLVLGLATSLVYNYAAADDAAPDLNVIVKVALALGPVLALASLGLALGEEIWRYEQALDTWRAGQIEAGAKVDDQRRGFEQEQEALDREFQRKEQRRERLARQKIARALSGRSVGDGGRSVGDGGRSEGEGGRLVGDGGRLVGDNGRSVGAQGAQWAGRGARPGFCRLWGLILICWSV